MAVKPTVSISVIRRLPRYYRFLGDLAKAGINRISSRELSERMGLTASQIRQDLNCFGGFGQQGYGYNVSSLREEIARILGLDNQLNTILIGVGNLGRAIVSHLDFGQRGFNLTAVFDNNPELCGTTIAGMTIMDPSMLEEYCSAHPTQVAILTIPRTAAEALSERLIQCGIRCFWNFSHYDFNLDYENVVVENVNLTDSLMTLGYRVNEYLRTQQTKTEE